MSGSLLVLIATIALAFKGIIASLIFQYGLGVSELVTLRFVISAPFFLLFCLLSWSQRSHIQRQDIPGLAALSTLFFVGTYADAVSVKYLGAGLSRMILFLFPLFIMIYDAFRVQQIPSWEKLAVFSIAYLGIGLMILGPGLQSLTHETWIGVACGLTSALTYATFLRLNQYMLKSVRPQAINAQVALVASVMMLTLEGQSLDLSPMNGNVWALIILLAIAATVIPFWLMLEGMRRTTAGHASLIAMVGPAITMTAAMVILNEQFSLIQWVGFALIMVGMGVLQWPSQRAKSASP